MDALSIFFVAEISIQDYKNYEAQMKDAVIKFSEFRHFLQQELLRRSKANPRYSLRAFARTLGVQSGFLSNLLSGKRRITVTTIRRFGAKLKLNADQVEAFEYEKNLDADQSIQFSTISVDCFAIISDWYHFAILELMSVKGFQSNAHWVAKKLGLSLAETQTAVDRLIRLGYIKISKNGKWSAKDTGTTTLGTKDTDEALRKMQKQILEKAIAALENVSVSKRDQSGMTMAISSDRLPEAKLKIKKFRRELCTYLEGGKVKDSVYQLSLSLYPLTNEIEG